MTLLWVSGNIAQIVPYFILGRSWENDSCIYGLQIVLGNDKLSTEMTVQNTNQKPFSFTTALHTYFQVMCASHFPTHFSRQYNMYLKCYNLNPKP
jgi:D-hexose-6-phosphate mutarotase